MGSTAEPPPSGFVVAPARPWWLALVLFLVVVAVAVSTAHLFRVSYEEFVHWYSGGQEVTDVARSWPWVATFAVVSAAVLAAALIGRLVQRRNASATGIEAVAASARGEPRRISLRASAVRAAATWVATSGLSSIGRESAIIELGGAFGTTAGRRFGGRGDVLATAGIAAAFAAAYHAPIAAVFYLEEHLRISRSRRAFRFASAAALVGHLLSVHAFGGHAVFPAVVDPTWSMLGVALIGVVPAIAGARLFRLLRVQVTAARASARVAVPWWLTVIAFALVAGLAVAVFPAAAGNGLQSLRASSLGLTVPLALGLCVGKLVGTTASLGSGAPGGALTPTIGISAGAAMLVLLMLSRVGLDLGSHVTWAVIVGAMAIGVSTGLKAPLMAVFLIPEMVGEYWLVPFVALVVLVGAGLDRLIDRRVGVSRPDVADPIYDADG